MVSCSGIALTDGGLGASALWRRLERTHLVSPGMQVRPRLPFLVHLLGGQREVEAPAVVESFLQLLESHT
jgi:hypothetical protein